jgi:hypothetical protein
MQDLFIYMKWENFFKVPKILKNFSLTLIQKEIFLEEIYDIPKLLLCLHFCVDLEPEKIRILLLTDMDIPRFFSLTVNFLE